MNEWKKWMNEINEEREWNKVKNEEREAIGKRREKWKKKN